MVPGKATGVPEYAPLEPPDPPPDPEPATNVIEFTLPTLPPGPALSITSRAICAPADSVTVLSTLCQACQSPVSGIATEPDTLTPFISRWNVPPWPADATRNVTV